MARAPFQVIVFPFVVVSNDVLYAVFRRRAPDVWQAVSGGGEGSESPREAAIRETLEETGLAALGGLVALDARASIPANRFTGTDHWPHDLLVVPEYSFGIRVLDRTVRLSDEHSEFAWLSFDEAHRRLTWDSNKIALWELHERFRRGSLFQH